MASRTCVLLACLLAVRVLHADSNQYCYAGDTAVNIKSIKCKEKAGEKTQTLTPGCVNNNAKLTFDELKCAKLVDIKACEKTGEISDKFSAQSLTDPDATGAVEYPLMFAADANISYALSTAALAEIQPLAAGGLIEVVNGTDRTGVFPATVLFIAADSAVRYSGTLQSSGTVRFINPPASVPAASPWAAALLLVSLVAAGGAALTRRILNTCP